RDAEMGITSRPVRHPLIDRRLTSADQPTYTALVAPQTDDYRDDHRMSGERALSGTMLVEMVREAAADATGAAVTLLDVAFGEPGMGASPTELVVTGTGDGAEGEWSWQVTARAFGSREAQTQTALVARSALADTAQPDPLALHEIRERCEAIPWRPAFDDSSSPVSIGQRWR